MDQYKLRFGQNVLHMPWWWFHALVIWLGLMGLILFFLGQRLVKPLFAVMGIVLGAVIATAIVSTRWPDASVLPWAIGGAVVLGALMLFLWRIWMAAVVGLFIAVLAPAVVLIVTGAGAPAIQTPIANTVQRVQEAIGADIGIERVDEDDADDPDAEQDEREAPDDDDDPTTGDDGEISLAAGFDPQELGPILDEGWTDVKTTVDTWWEDLGGSNRFAVGAASAGGGVVAFVLGLALPYFGASVVTAFVGTLLMLPGVLLGVKMFDPELATRMTSSPRMLVLWLSVATFIGAFIQWMVLKRRTDK